MAGYVRLLLLALSLASWDSPTCFLTLYGISTILDGFDGYFARKLNQTSAFGAWLDVVIDLISRGALWCFISKWGYFMAAIEWLTFVSTHSRGADWKHTDDEFPYFCRLVMANGFKTPIGTCAITGLFVLPLWIYSLQMGVFTHLLPLPGWVQYTLLVSLIAGRVMALVPELFFIYLHIKDLLKEDSKNK